MELLTQVSNTQFLFPVAAVAVVLVCAALVFVFGFHSAQQPQFDKLSLVVDDRKSSNKKRKPKDKKSSPNRSTSEDGKTKVESSKKSPSKEKKEDKVKEADKPKLKENKVAKPVKKESNAEAKKPKKGKSAGEAEKPADFDDGVWEEVPKKSDKKKVKSSDDKKEEKKSPAKKNKKVNNADVEAARPQEEPVQQTIKVVSAVGPQLDEESARALQAQVEEFQRAMKEAELREQAALGTGDDEGNDEEAVPEVKDLRSNKKMENKEKQNKKKATETVANTKIAKQESVETSESAEADEKPNVPASEESADNWTDAKTTKKGKKKARKDQ